MNFYFEKFEQRIPEKALPYSAKVESIWQLFATISIIIGFWYISWRWSSSLNTDALWFSIPLILAETLAYIGLLLFYINIWKVKDYPKVDPPELYSDCVNDKYGNTRPLAVDVYFPSYNEDVELVRLSIKDAKKITYPHPIDLKIFVLDDGKRPEMKQVADEEGVGYITRDNNQGFKAGNMRNAMENTSGDFIVICDADTRPFPTILEHCMGYFTDPDVAWVQTPQWFFDLPAGTPLPVIMKKYLSLPGFYIGKLVEKIAGPINVGQDPFCNDPKMFYDIILRRRNWANASFCCGAGSIHRREAVMNAAIKTFADSIDGYIRKYTKEIEDETLKKDLHEAMARELMLETEITPYKYHVSEDIYTSIIIHSDSSRKWKSVFHPDIESKMLSPQDLLSWTVQRFKYAGGSLDIVMHDNPLFRKGLSFTQKVMYGATFWSYFSGIWNIIFLLSPIVYMFSGISPVSTDSVEFFKHFLPFVIFMQFSFMLGTWGIPAWKGSSFYLSFFPINLRAIWTVLKGEKIKFHITPKTRQAGNYLRLVVPQIVVMSLTLLGMLFAIGKILFGYSDNIGGLVANIFWGGVNFFSLWGIVAAAIWKPDEE